MKKSPKTWEQTTSLARLYSWIARDNCVSGSKSRAPRNGQRLFCCPALPVPGRPSPESQKEEREDAKRQGMERTLQGKVSLNLPPHTGPLCFTAPLSLFRIGIRDILNLILMGNAEVGPVVERPFSDASWRLW